MKITNLIVFIVFYRLSLYQFGIVKKFKKRLKLTTAKALQIRIKDFAKPNSQKLFIPSEFPTQVTFFRDGRNQASEKKHLKLEQKSNSNQLIKHLKVAQVSLESKVINLFIYRLDNLNNLQQELLEVASHEPGRTISIASSFDMSNKHKRQLLKAIHKKLNPNVQVEFLSLDNPNLGIEMRDRGYRIHSNLDACITEIGDQVEQQAPNQNPQPPQLISA